MKSIFEEIVFKFDGMLAPAVYEKLYEAAKCGGTIIEVGTALGAGTAALALGLKDSGKPGRIYTFDPMNGGPRRKAINGKDDRTNHVRNNLAEMGVDHLVELVASTLPEGIGVIPADEPITLLLLDADGRIDRDLLLIYDRVATGAPIIVDDYADKVRLNKASYFEFRIDAKMRLTYLLVNWLRNEGLLTEGHVERNTYFGNKPETPAGRITEAGALDVYREMVFTRSRFTPLQAWRRSAIRMLEGAHPGALQKLRVMKRRDNGATKEPPR